MKLIFFVSLFLLSFSGFSQSKTDRKESYPVTRMPAKFDLDRSVLETVYYPTFGDECARDLVTSGIEGWGRVSGMNFFGDLEKAQRLEFQGSDSYVVVGAMVFFETPKIVGNGLINCKVYSVDPTSGGPAQLKGFSDGLNVDQIVAPDSIARPTNFTFENGVEVDLEEPQFFVSVDFSNLYASQDTVVILQTIPECGVGTDTWELFADGTTWTSISSSISWELNADFVIAAIVDFNDPTSTEAFIQDRDLIIHPASPNPATSQISFNYTLNTPSPVQIAIFSTDGQRIKDISYSVKSTGDHQEVLEVNSLPSGLYFYTIETGHGRLGSRFSVQ